MNFFRKLEQRFGRYAIHNLMYYIIFLYGAGILISLVNPAFYINYLALDAGEILHGQVWRVVTFLVCPPSSGSMGGLGLFFNLLMMYLYYNLGTTLERVWGVFRFNAYFFVGILGHIVAAFIIYFVTGHSYPLSTYYLNNSLMLAFAATFPQMQFYLWGVLPVKALWLAVFIGAEFVYDFLTGGIAARIAILLSLANFILFFLLSKSSSISPKEIKRKQAFKASVKQAEVQKIRHSHHKCAVCGRTEKDHPELEFRYCSKCAGGMEYCMDHLYTHKHVTEEDLKQLKTDSKQ